MTIKKKIELDIECQSCDGTGIYVGFAEKDGIGVVCNRCKGTGRDKYVFEYKPFIARRTKAGIVHVVQTNPGIGLGIGKNNEGKQFGLNSFGGMSYQDWVRNDGKFPKNSEMRQFVCPQWWYQSVDYDKKPDWDECWKTLGSSFSSCKRFKNKENCWKRWDKKQIGK